MNAILKALYKIREMGLGYTREGMYVQSYGLCSSIEDWALELWEHKHYISLNSAIKSWTVENQTRTDTTFPINVTDQVASSTQYFSIGDDIAPDYKMEYLGQRASLLLFLINYFEEKHYEETGEIL